MTIPMPKTPSTQLLGTWTSREWVFLGDGFRIRLLKLKRWRSEVGHSEIQEWGILKDSYVVPFLESNVLG